MEKTGAGARGKMETSCLADGWSCSHRRSRMDAGFAWKKSGGSVTKLIWDDAAHLLKHEGAPALTGSDQSLVTVVGK